MDRIHVTFRRLNTWAKREFDTLFLLYTLDDMVMFINNITTRKFTHYHYYSRWTGDRVAYSNVIVTRIKTQSYFRNDILCKNNVKLKYTQSWQNKEYILCKYLFVSKDCWFYSTVHMYTDYMYWDHIPPVLTYMYNGLTDPKLIVPQIRHKINFYF